MAQVEKEVIDLTGSNKTSLFSILKSLPVSKNTSPDLEVANSVSTTVDSHRSCQWKESLFTTQKAQNNEDHSYGSNCNPSMLETFAAVEGGRLRAKGFREWELLESCADSEEDEPGVGKKNRKYRFKPSRMVSSTDASLTIDASKFSVVESVLDQENSSKRVEVLEASGSSLKAQSTFVKPSNVSPPITDLEDGEVDQQRMPKSAKYNVTKDFVPTKRYFSDAHYDFPNDLRRKLASDGYRTHSDHFNYQDGNRRRNYFNEQTRWISKSSDNDYYRYHMDEDSYRYNRFDRRYCYHQYISLSRNSRFSEEQYADGRVSDQRRVFNDKCKGERRY